MNEFSALNRVMSGHISACGPASGGGRTDSMLHFYPDSRSLTIQSQHAAVTVLGSQQDPLFQATAYLSVHQQGKESISEGLVGAIHHPLDSVSLLMLLGSHFIVFRLGLSFGFGFTCISRPDAVSQFLPSMLLIWA